MREIVSAVTSKGQITIPAEVRKHLDIKQGDKVSFVLEEEGEVRLVSPRYRNIASLRGAAGSLGKALSRNEMLAIAHEDRAREITDAE